MSPWGVIKRVSVSFLVLVRVLGFMASASASAIFGVHSWIAPVSGLPVASLMIFSISLRFMRGPFLGCVCVLGARLSRRAIRCRVRVVARGLGV